MDAYERVAQRQRKQLRTIGIGAILLGTAVIVAAMVNDEMYRAVGGTARGLLAGGAFIAAGITAIWRAYKKT